MAGSRVRFLPVFVAVIAASTASAHDLWLIPPEKGEVKKPLAVRAVSGSEFPKGDHAPDPAKFGKLIHVRPNASEGKLAAAGTDAKDGLLTFTPDEEGVHIVAVTTVPKLITLEADKFNEYLVSDGLPHIYRLRFKEGTLNQPGRERYSKTPTALVRVGNKGLGTAIKPIGLQLEIVPLADPFAAKVGDTLKVRVLFREKPLADARLGWAHPGDGEEPAGTVRTDEAGIARVPVAKTGLMTIRLTHMTRPKLADYEWESFWTTLTFRIPE